MNTTLPDRSTMIAAFLERDSAYEGIFFTAVRTTGIFCRPTCTARKPRPENVEFYATAREAIAAGYRPCRVCHPMEAAGSVPEWLAPLLAELAAADGVAPGDQALRDRGIDPARVRRWFKRHHGMTFRAYARQLRINRAYGTLRHDASVIDAAYESGYESVSGFGEAFRRTAGFAPSGSREHHVVTVARIPTPLGPMVAGAVDGALCLLEFADRPMLETQLQRTRRDFRARTVAGIDPLFDAVHAELDEYFAGRRREFTVSIAEFGSTFQRSVWAALRAIPYGETRTYGEQATAVGRPEAVRAVGRANGDNRITIIIPCHRVIGADGRLTGYGGGLERKRRLLEIEGALPGRARRVG